MTILFPKHLDFLLFLIQNLEVDDELKNILIWFAIEQKELELSDFLRSIIQLFEEKDRITLENLFLEYHMDIISINRTFHEWNSTKVKGISNFVRLQIMFEEKVKPIRDKISPDMKFYFFRSRFDIPELTISLPVNVIFQKI
jgi:hypothetical protein